MDTNGNEQEEGVKYGSQDCAGKIEEDARARPDMERSENSRRCCLQCPHGKAGCGDPQLKCRAPPGGC